MAVVAMIGALIVVAPVLPASATVFTNTLTGTLAGGADNTGLFGAPNTDLTDVPFSIVYTLDTSLGDYAAFPATGSGGVIETLLKQTILSQSPISTQITINGQSLFIAGNSILFNGQLQSNPATYFASFDPFFQPFGKDGKADVFDQDAFKINSSGSICIVNCAALVDNFISTSVTFGLPPEIYLDPFPALSSLNLQGSATGTGQFQFAKIPIVQNQLGDPNFEAVGRFNFETFALSEVQPIPEPSSMTLFLVGLVVLGFGVSRSRPV